MDERIQELKEQIKKEKSPIKKADLLLDLSSYMQSLFYNLPEAERHAIQALTIAKENQDPRIVGFAQNILGMIYWRQGKFEDAIECTDKAIKISELIKNKSLEAQGHGLLGLIQEQKGELDQAIFHHEKSIALYRELGNERLVAAQYNNIGNAYWDKGDLEKALEYHQKSLNIKEKILESMSH